MGKYAQTAFVDGMITIYRWSTKKNKLLFSISIFSKQMEGCRFSFLFSANKGRFLLVPFFIYIYIMKWNYIYIYAAISNRKQRKETHVIFHNPFAVCSSCKLKFVVCPFVDEDTNVSYPFANSLNGLNGLAHLCMLVL
jgi:hypothetical protein